MSSSFFQLSASSLSPESMSDGYRDSTESVDASDTDNGINLPDRPGFDAVTSPLKNCEIEGGRQYSTWSGYLSSLLASFLKSTSEGVGALPLLGLEIPSGYRRRSRSSRWPKRIRKCFVFTILLFFIMLGVIQFISLLAGVILSFFPDESDRAVNRWLDRNTTNGDASRYPTDISRDITPVPCHSHNDYWRRVPLYSALQAGCIGVEADVWLMDDELYVGHTTSSLTPNRTLRNLYINPLRKILERQNPITHFHPSPDNPRNGVFDTDPSQSLILLIDFKTDGAATWPHVVEQLSPLRERGYLTYFNGTDLVNGPITVVGTGETPFDLLTSNSTYRDIFFDAPLEVMMASDEFDEQTTSVEEIATATPAATTSRPPAKNLGQGMSGTPADVGPNTFNPTNSYYASVSFKESIGTPWRFRLSPKQMERLRAQIRVAHNRGLKVRYWGVPNWPRSLRNHLWSVLIQEGVDMLNVDDLVAATRKEWIPSFVNWW